MNAILLVNMGSPASEQEMKTFLRKMFLDPAILPIPFLSRKIHSIIISNSRYKKSWTKYELIGGSPSSVFDETLIKKLSEELGNDYFITNAYSYVAPFIQDKIADIYNRGIRNLHVIPLYPQFSLTTTGSIKREISKISRTYKDLNIKLTESFSNNPHFIQYWHTLIQDEIISTSAHQHISTSAPLLLFTAHSIPAHNIKRGDTYVNEINESCESIAKSLGLDYRISYQSKFGRVKWLEPDTKIMLKQLAHTPILSQERNSQFSILHSPFSILNLAKRSHELANNSQFSILLVPVSFLSENLETMYDLDLDIIPYAQKNLNINNISRVRIPQSHPLLIQTLKSLITEN